MKNKKNNLYFKCYKSKHYHRDYLEKNKWSKATVIKVTVFDSKNDRTLQAFQQQNQKN